MGIMLKAGVYVAENNDSVLDQYKITMQVKETDSSFIFVLIEFDSRYSAAHIDMLFKKSKRAVIRKDRVGHAIRVWSSEDFTFYPYQAGVPYWFKMTREVRQ